MIAVAFSGGTDGVYKGGVLMVEQTSTRLPRMLPFVFESIGEAIDFLESCERVGIDLEVTSSPDHELSKLVRLWRDSGKRT